MQLEVKTADCAILVAQLDECNSQLEQKNHTLHEAMEALEDLESENANLQVQVTSVHQTNKQLSTELASISHECEALRDAVDTRDGESTELRKLLFVKEYELANLNGLLDAKNNSDEQHILSAVSEHERDTLRAKLEAIQLEHGKLLARLDMNVLETTHLRTQLEEASHQKLQLTGQLDELRLTNERLYAGTGDPSRLQRSTLDSGQEDVSLTSQLEDKSRESSRLRGQLKARTDECTRASEQVDQLSRENAGLHGQLDTLKHETARLTLQTEEGYALQDEVDSLKREKARLLSQLGAHPVAHQPSELERLQSVVDLRTRENTRLNAKIEEFSVENTRLNNLSSNHVREVSRIRTQLETTIDAQAKANELVHEMQLKVDALMREKGSVQLQLDRLREGTHESIMTPGGSAYGYQDEQNQRFDDLSPAVLEADLFTLRAELGTRTLENSLLRSQVDERAQHSALLRSQLDDSTRLNAQLRTRVEEQAVRIRSQVATLTNLHNEVADCAALAAHSQEISFRIGIFHYHL